MSKHNITDPKYVQERITELRCAREVSEYRLSKDLGYSKGYIQSISSGKTFPSIAALYEICDYFKITLKDFFNDEAAPDSELLHNLLLEVRSLPPEEQYFLYHFLLARKDRKSKEDMSKKDNEESV